MNNKKDAVSSVALWWMGAGAGAGAGAFGSCREMKSRIRLFDVYWKRNLKWNIILETFVRLFSTVRQLN